MAAMVEKIIKKIKSLPPLPENINKVREICNNPESTIKELVPIVKEDPMFTADILKAANSPLYGFSRQITSIDQAVSLFGMGTIQGFAISYAMRKGLSIQLDAYGLDPKALQKVSSMQNSLTFQWGKTQVQSHQPEMLTISLLMELGKVVAALVIDEAGKTSAFKEAILATQTNEEIIAVEKEMLGITSDWIAALMFKHWQFSETMIAMMQHLPNPAKADESLRRQTQILHVVKEALPPIKPMCPPCLEEAVRKAETFGLDLTHFQTALETIKA